MPDFGLTLLVLLVIVLSVHSQNGPSAMSGDALEKEGLVVYAVCTTGQLRGWTCGRAISESQIIGGPSLDWQTCRCCIDFLSEKWLR